MLNFNLNSRSAAEKLIRLCESYKDVMSVDVVCGRQILDGCSMLGVVSLIGNFVTVIPNSSDESLVKRFEKDLEGIK